MTDDADSSIIPAQLRDWRFVLVKAGTKKAFEANWQTTANYAWDDPKLVRHLKAGGNYGVLPGEEHVVIETDIPELQELLENSFPPTFTQRSPGHGTKHFFYNGHSKIVPLFDKPTRKDKKNTGHVKCGGSFVVGPGSVHPNGGKYSVSDDRPLASITEDQITDVLVSFIAQRAQAFEKSESRRLGYQEFSISDLVNQLKLDDKGDGHLQGPHPIHGSSTGSNFTVDLRKNVWHCFRCVSGGGPLQLLAVAEGIIDCSDAVKGGLRGDAFKKAYSLAIERGYIHPPRTPVQTWNPSESDIQELSQPLSFDRVADVLSITVKRDATSKKVLFAGNILTYTDREQVNLLMAAESSAGKSYLPLEIASYFPAEDVIILGGASPTSFFHEVSGGELALWDPEKKQSVVHLENKILIFLDQPHTLLLEKLRPFLSHDQKKIKYKISDRSQKSGLRTKTVILVGFSTVNFCTANFNLDQQEKTRNWQLSPETDPDKVKAAIELLLVKKSDWDSFQKRISEDPARAAIIRRVLDIKNAKLRDVIIPPTLQESIYGWWKKNHPHPIPRNVRDFERFLSLVKAHAILNWRIRPTAGEGRVEAIETDVQEAEALYLQISEANERGIAPQAYEIYKSVIEPLGSNGVTKREILRKYYTVYHRSLPLKRLEKEILPSLDASGLIAEEPDPNQRNRNLIYPHLEGSNQTPIVEPAASSITPPKVGVNTVDLSGRASGSTFFCEVCNKPGTPISRIGESGVRAFCNDHLGQYKGDL